MLWFLLIKIIPLVIDVIGYITPIIAVFIGWVLWELELAVKYLDSESSRIKSRQSSVWTVSMPEDLVRNLAKRTSHLPPFIANYVFNNSVWRAEVEYKTYGDDEWLFRKEHKSWRAIRKRKTPYKDKKFVLSLRLSFGVIVPIGPIESEQQANSLKEYIRFNLPKPIEFSATISPINGSAGLMAMEDIDKWLWGIKNENFLKE